ncbi:MAG TPA: hypothetical protein VLT82_19540 [Myxococcaceae bacterium]|nr:hypothetical protein [Myxococcaceae bacterium]
MRQWVGAAVLWTALLACAPSVALKHSAWSPSSDSTASRRPLDCSDLRPPAPVGTIGDPVEPGRGAALQQPADLGVGPVRLVWTSTVSGVHLDWVAPAVPEARRLWALRVADSGRCVVGAWNASQLGIQVIRHVFWKDGQLEVVLLGLGPPPRFGWMVLVTDGSNLWSGLESRQGRPGAIVAEQAEFREEAAGLRLLMLDGGRSAILDFDGRQFASRP